MKNYDFELIKFDNNTFELLLTNIWKKESLTQNIKALEKFDIPTNSKLTVNFQNLKECDSTAIIYLISFFKGFKEENLTIKNLDSFENIYRFYEKHYQDNTQDIRNKENFLEIVGKKFYSGYKETINFVDIFALTMAMTALGMEKSFDKFRNVGMKPFYLSLVKILKIFDTLFVRTYMIIKDFYHNHLNLLFVNLHLFPPQ